jgi:hypothetical protein
VQLVPLKTRSRASRTIHVARDEQACRDRPAVAVAQDGDHVGEVGGQCLDGTLGLALLEQGEERVQDDHADDRHRQDRRGREPREHGRRPEQQRQRMRQLHDDVAPPAPAPAPRQLVGPVLDQPALGLAAREPLAPRAQVGEQLLLGLERVERQRWLCGDLHPPPSSVVQPSPAGGRLRSGSTRNPRR